MRSDLASPSVFASTPSVQLSFQNDIQHPAPNIYHARGTFMLYLDTLVSVSSNPHCPYK